MISDEEMFCLFEKAFGHRTLDKRVDFIKDILRRYKAMGEPVCVSLFAMPPFLCFVFVRCVGRFSAFCRNADVLCDVSTITHHASHSLTKR